MTTKTSTPSHQDAPRLLYSRREAARMLSVSIRSLDYLIATKELATRRIGKKVLIPYGELVRYAKGNHYGSIRPQTLQDDSQPVQDDSQAA
jgi:excisionase family DNA binding protein